MSKALSRIKIQKGADTKLKFVDGFARTTMLPGVYPDVDVNKCVLKAGQKWEAELYKFEDKAQMFFFVTGRGYICLPNQAFNITEPAVFVPFFDKERFSVKAAEDTDLEFLQFVCRQTEFDKKMMNTIRTTLPRFKLMSECETYEEPFKGPGMKSPILIMHRLFGKFSMGSTIGNGPNWVHEHVHHDLVQWYYLFPGSHITYTAGGETVDMTGGDLSYITEGVPHGSVTGEGEKCDYVWFEVASQGYQL
jgi:mannose-6-phosphate isomerase-like protein (cupin superfamily)